MEDFIEQLMQNDIQEMAQNTKPGTARDKFKEVNRRAKPVAAPQPKPKTRAQEQLARFNEANPGLLEFLAGAASWSDFASSLRDSLVKQGWLTERQLQAARSMQAKCDKPAAAAPVKVDLTPIREMFDAAPGKKPVYRAEGLVITKAGDRSTNPGALYVKGDGEYQGKVQGTEFFKLRRTPGWVEEALGIIAKDPKEAAISYGRRTGRCACCGRELTNADSIALGIGPICAEKWGFA